MAKKSFYLTTPIYYVNDVPHIGHAYTTVAADSLARFKRLMGFDVFFLTGTDEHGQKVQRAAESQGLEPLQLADRVVTRFKNLWKALNISNDDFIRTTEQRHIAAVQRIFKTMYENGDIYLGEYEDWYCTPDETFFTEKQLLSGKCPDCGRDVERVREKSYFFRMSKYADTLLKHIKDNPDFISPKSRRNEIISFIESGLRDLSVSRTSFQWGIPVPFNADHVIYVWIDALTNYITAAGIYSDREKFHRYWPADLHLIGKDILRFHAVYWPTMLMSAGLPLPNRVFAHGWWTIEGQKMSKSLGNVQDPQALAEEYGVDPFRYFLLREVPFGLDGDFSRRALHLRINSDLANDLGNLVSRVLTMAEKFSQGKVPPGIGSSSKLSGEAAATWQEVIRAMDDVAFHQALTAIWAFVNRVNKYIDDQKPWELFRYPEKKAALGAVISELLGSLRTLAVMISPFMPATGQKIWAALGFSDDLSENKFGDDLGWPGIAPGQSIRTIPPLFPRIDFREMS